MFLRAVAVLLILGSATLRSQDTSTVDQGIQKHFEAVTLYRQQDLPGALAMLDRISLDKQEKVVGAIHAQVARIAAGWPPRKEDVIQWTPRLLRALAALHMEAAIAARASTGRDARTVFQAHVALARTLFSAAVLLTGQDDTSAARWLLAIGLEQMADGRFSDTYSLLIPACEEHENYAPLVIACGSITETYAGFPAEAGLPNARPGAAAILSGLQTTSLSYAVRRLGQARAARNDQLNAARRYFARAIELDPSSDEAPLRLANVRMRQGAVDEAAQILERLLERRSLDVGTQYLARLFLARARDRQNRLQDAAALLSGTQSFQSGLLERAHNALRRGNAREAADLADRAAQTVDDDPWWAYRFGQYWIPRDLFKELRQEALK